MKNSKKQLLWDSVLVLPFLLYTVVWLVLAFGFRVDFAPSGSYEEAMLFNLLLPFGIIGVGQILYAVRLIRETLRGKDSTPGKKVLYGILIWLIVANLYFAVYLYRVVVLSKKTATTGR